MIYIMCDETSCIHNRVHNGKFNRCFNNNVTIINSNSCNFIVKEIPIEKLELSIRQYNCLKKAGINTSNELSQYDVETLKKVRNLSDNDIKDLIKKGYVNKY